MQNNILSNIEKYYTKTIALTLQSTDSKDVIDKYYREGEKRRRDRIENPRKVASLSIDLAQDNNKPIFSFNFGASLLDDFIRLEFGEAFGVSILDSFLS